MKPRFSSRETIEGFAFPDFVRSERRSSRNYEEGSGKRSMRVFLLPFALIFLIGLLVIRLLSVTLFQGKYYTNLSNSNRVRTTVIHAPRGIIFDRNGTPLVFNIPGFRQEQHGSSDQAKIVLLANEEATEKIARGEKNIEVDNLRQYPYKDAFAHVLGYIGQITKEELDAPTLRTYNSGDIVGKTGIEQQYEEQLRGQDGKELLEVDAMGKEMRTLGKQDPVAGRNITTTLDAKLQQTAYKAMRDIKKGAVVVSTPQGEIVALVSKPSFDPNVFTLGKTYKVASDSAYTQISQVLLDGDNQPLLDRAISGTYPPGSTFKLVVAAAGLESGAIDEHFIVNDTGTLHLGEFSFGSWYFLQYGRTDGELNVVSAIKRSNDIFFYKTAEAVGVNRLATMAKKFGLGQKLGIDIAGEATGVVPDDSWKKKVIGEQWYLGDTYHYGIGQGYLLTTPLQVNGWTQAIANGGMLYQPRLLKNTTNTTNTTNKPIRTNILSQKTHELIHEGMIESCSTGGVAWSLFDFKVKNAKLPIDGKNFLAVLEATTSASLKDYRRVSVACKTGTAQHGTEETMPHAWITLFAPAYDPQIVVTVLAESSGEGSNVAAPVAKKILEEWFTR